MPGRASVPSDPAMTPPATTQILPDESTFNGDSGTPLLSSHMSIPCRSKSVSASRTPPIGLAAISPSWPRLGCRSQ